MPKVALLNQEGKKLGTVELIESIFGVEPNQQVLYDVVNAQRAAMRQGTQKAKTRSEVRGGGRKPWRQKGTGRARQGSIRAPHWRGGGVVFAPTPRSYEVKVNKKVKQLALKSALSAKVIDNSIVVLDKLVLESHKTKEFANVLKALKIEGKVIFGVTEYNENIELASRNIPTVLVSNWDHVSVYDILNTQNLVLTQDALKSIEEVLG